MIEIKSKVNYVLPLTTDDRTYYIPPKGVITFNGDKHTLHPTFVEAERSNFISIKEHIKK